MAVFTDAELDDMHHALGRPEGPEVTPYRNYYCLDRDCEQASQMAASAGWRLIGHINDGKDALFAVTDIGRAAMWKWVQAKRRNDGVRRYVIYADGTSHQSVWAKSRAAAKHLLYLHLSDAGWCHDYPAFLRLRPRALTRAA